jgi:hypothetical protein
MVTPIPVVTYEKKAIPADYLRRRCVGMKLSESETWGDVEATAAKLWICVQDLNWQLERIEGLE